MLTRQFDNIKEYYGKCSVDLSGEIIIQNSDKTQLLALNQGQHDTINDCIKRLKYAMPMLKLSKKDSLTECRIELFAYKKPTAKENMLDDLKKELIFVLQKLLADGCLSVNMNVFGTFSNARDRLYYRFLNRGEQVEYVLTEKFSLSMLDRLWNHHTKAYFVTLLLLFVMLDMCYEALIAGHGWQITNLWDLFSSTPKAAVNPKDVI